jgi:hypothetical protein
VTHVRHGSSHFGTPVVIGSIIAPTAVPRLTPSTADIQSSATVVTLAGNGFGDDKTQVRVMLITDAAEMLQVSQGPLSYHDKTRSLLPADLASWSIHRSPHATVSSVSTSSCILTLSELANAHKGVLKAMIVVNGVGSSWRPVRNVKASTPAVTNTNIILYPRSAGHMIDIVGHHFGNVKASISLTVASSAPAPPPGPQFIQVNTEAAPCPSGYSQVADLATCNAAATALIAAGQATQMHTTGDWVNHVGLL